MKKLIAQILLIVFFIETMGLNAFANDADSTNTTRLNIERNNVSVGNGCVYFDKWNDWSYRDSFSIYTNQGQQQIRGIGMYANINSPSNTGYADVICDIPEEATRFEVLMALENNWCQTENYGISTFRIFVDNRLIEEFITTNSKQSKNVSINLPAGAKKLKLEVYQDWTRRAKGNHACIWGEPTFILKTKEYNSALIDEYNLLMEQKNKFDGWNAQYPPVIIGETGAYLWDIFTFSPIDLGIRIKNDITGEYKNEAANTTLNSLVSTYSNDDQKQFIEFASLYLGYKSYGAENETIETFVKAHNLFGDISKYTKESVRLFVEFISAHEFDNDGAVIVDWGESLDIDNLNIIKNVGLGELLDGFELAWDLIEHAQLSEQQNMTLLMLVANYGSNKQYLENCKKTFEDAEEDEAADVYQIALESLNDVYTQYINNGINYFSDNPNDEGADFELLMKSLNLVYDVAGGESLKAAMKNASINAAITNGARMGKTVGELEKIGKAAKGTVTALLWAHTATSLIAGEALSGNNLYDSLSLVYERRTIIPAQFTMLQTAYYVYTANPSAENFEKLRKQISVCCNSLKSAIEPMKAYEESLLFTLEGKVQQQQAAMDTLDGCVERLKVLTP